MAKHISIKFHYKSLGDLPDFGVLLGVVPLLKKSAYETDYLFPDTESRLWTMVKFRENDAAMFDKQNTQKKFRSIIHEFQSSPDDELFRDTKNLVRLDVPTQQFRITKKRYSEMPGAESQACIVSKNREIFVKDSMSMSWLEDQNLRVYKDTNVQIEKNGKITKIPGVFLELQRPYLTEHERPEVIKQFWKNMGTLNLQPCHIEKRAYHQFTL